MYVTEARICSCNRADTLIAKIDKGIETKRGQKKTEEKEKEKGKRRFGEGGKEEKRNLHGWTWPVANTK